MVEEHEVDAAAEPVMVKVHVTLDDGVVAGETLWAKVLLDGPTRRYEVASIPFLADAVALGDVVEAHFDPRWGLEVDRVVHESDQVTVPVAFTGAAVPDAGGLDPVVVAGLDACGARCERTSGNHFALSVARRRYAALVDLLARWQLLGLVDCHG